MPPTTATPRSLLFVPGHRESMLAKAPTTAADAVVLDLEDSVPPAEKSVARERVAAIVGVWPADAPRPYVRINAPSFGMLSEDVAPILNRPDVGLVVPKVDLPAELFAVFQAAGREREMIVNLETPRAILHAEAFADTY